MLAHNLGVRGFDKKSWFLPLKVPWGGTASLVWLGSKVGVGGVSCWARWGLFGRGVVVVVEELAIIDNQFGIDFEKKSTHVWSMVRA